LLEKNNKKMFGSMGKKDNFFCSWEEEIAPPPPQLRGWGGVATSSSQLR